MSKYVDVFCPLCNTKLLSRYRIDIPKGGGTNTNCPNSECKAKLYVPHGEEYAVVKD